MRRIVFFTLIVSALLGCGKHPYLKMEERELASGKQVDSIMMGMYFGMSKTDFFDQCMVLNKQKRVYQGPGSMTVEFINSQDFKSSVRVQFKPKFFNLELYEMTFSYAYEAWAPWNEEYQAEELIQEVKRWMEARYGTGFVEIKKENVAPAYAKVDGNRRIHIKVSNDSRVEVNFTDLPIYKELEKLSEDKST